MKNRKRGFSLVELLIVLAVIAALIATITPVALNAIRKSKATQVAQNLKTLASALENAAYVNGTKSGYVKNPGGNAAVTLAELGRDIDDSLYGIEYTKTSSWAFEAVVYYKGTDVDTNMVAQVLGNATSTKDWNYSGLPNENTLGIEIPDTNEGMFYTFTFSVY